MVASMRIHEAEATINCHELMVASMRIHEAKESVLMNTHRSNH
jgi:hypothetical protein